MSSAPIDSSSATPGDDADDAGDPAAPFALSRPPAPHHAVDLERRIADLQQQISALADVMRRTPPGGVPAFVPERAD